MSIQLINSKQIKMNQHYINRYIKFISSRENKKIINETDYHHILPKAKDMFPEFKDLKMFPWNGIHLLHREHFIAHWLLAKSFPGSSQSLAFYHMSNNRNKRKSRDYEFSKKLHIETVKQMTQCPSRNKKISDALSGKPKSDQHKKNLSGERTSEEKIAISLGVKRAGFKFSDDQKKEMSIKRTGRKVKPRSQEDSLFMAKSKMSFKILTPIGIFDSYAAAGLAYNVNPNKLVSIFKKLTRNPRKLFCDLFNLSPNKTYEEQGFGVLPK